MTTVFVFVSRDAREFEAASTLVKACNGTLVDRLSNKISDLQLVARYRVVEPVCVVVVNDGAVVLRMPRLPSADELRQDIAMVTRC